MFSAFVLDPIRIRHTQKKHHKTAQLEYVSTSTNCSYYNLGHNILELYNVLVKIRITTGKAKRDIYYSKLGI